MSGLLHSFGGCIAASPPGSPQCGWHLPIASSMCGTLDLPLQTRPTKRVGPITCTDTLDIEFDSVNQFAD